MIDTRCWECFKIDKDGNPLTKQIDMVYIGGGHFKCPKCAAMLDYSEDTYLITITRKEKEGRVCTEFNEMDTKIKEEDIDIIKDDIYDLFSDLCSGCYTCEICWFYYEVGNEEEWDCETAMFSCEEIEEE